jgi:hypothetical protein
LVSYSYVFQENLLILYDTLQEGGPLSHDAFHKIQSIIRETFRENGALIHALFYEHLSLIAKTFHTNTADSGSSVF